MSVKNAFSLAKSTGLIPPNSTLPKSQNMALSSSKKFPASKFGTFKQSKKDEIMNQDNFEIRNYQGLITNSSIEMELINLGYSPVSKIVIKDTKKQYIKAINKNGQTVFISIDTNGYTTTRTSDLTLIESSKSSIIPYSMKTGAYECAKKDVSGIAFVCGSDSVCVLARGEQDLTPTESNFVFVEKAGEVAAETEGSIVPYPVIKLSEIKANPELILENTDIVTRRLRNTAYQNYLKELSLEQTSIENLSHAFNKFDMMKNTVAVKLNSTLTQLEEWNTIYINKPPATDELKAKYRQLQFNLTQRNEGVATLLRSMKKVADLRFEIDTISKTINDMTEYCEKEFENIDYAMSDS